MFDCFICFADPVYAVYLKAHYFRYQMETKGSTDPLLALMFINCLCQKVQQQLIKTLNILLMPSSCFRRSLERGKFRAKRKDIHVDRVDYVRSTNDKRSQNDISYQLLLLNASVYAHQQNTDAGIVHLKILRPVT